ncbi:MAG: hypothetical protein AAGD33_20200 [Actinomycetota bacterium]
MAFVNRSNAEKQEDIQASGEPIDFDPLDPDTVKVHYDLSAWNFDQRAELAEALAGDSIPHGWDGEELVVPEEVEEAADAMFERLESQLGPFPIALEDDAEATEYGLDEWSDADRELLRDALVDSEVPHRWEDSTVVVAADAEEAVDEILDAIEAGELVATDTASAHAPEGALSDLFLAADRLAREPSDAKARRSLIELGDTLDASQPPYAFPPRPWETAIETMTSIIVSFDDEAAGRDRSTGSDAGVAESSDAVGAGSTAGPIVESKRQRRRRNFGAAGAVDDGDDDSAVAVGAEKLRTILRPYV